MKEMEPAALEAVPDRAAPHAESGQLRTRHDAVLPGCERRDLAVNL
ncbi:MAG: hypothetical protein M3P50_07135 [Actinomycetota bacterium]|nr:hypothetical protein [Actinomycetota bacterium]